MECLPDEIRDKYQLGKLFPTRDPSQDNVFLFSIETIVSDMGK